MKRKLLPTLIRLAASLTIFFGISSLYARAYGASRDYGYYLRNSAGYEYSANTLTEKIQYGYGYFERDAGQYVVAASTKYPDYNQVYVSRYQRLYGKDYLSWQRDYQKIYNYTPRYYGIYQRDAYVYGNESGSQLRDVM